MSTSTPTELTDRASASFSFAQEVVKQQLTLATAIFTLTLTFLKQVVPRGTDATLLEFGWGCYIGSILFGLLALMALAGTIDGSGNSSFSGSVPLFAILQALTFFAAVVLTFLFGLKVL